MQNDYVQKPFDFPILDDPPELILGALKLFLYNFNRFDGQLRIVEVVLPLDYPILDLLADILHRTVHQIRHYFILVKGWLLTLAIAVDSETGQLA